MRLDQRGIGGYVHSTVLGACLYILHPSPVLHLCPIFIPGLGHPHPLPFPVDCSLFHLISLGGCWALQPAG